MHHVFSVLGFPAFPALLEQARFLQSPCVSWNVCFTPNSAAGKMSLVDGAIGL